MRLGLFVPTFRRDYNKISASYWIRVFQMVRHYKQLGVEVHVNNYLIRYDHVIVYRGFDKRHLLKIKYLSKMSKKVWWDTCVNQFVNHHHTNEKNLRTVREICDIVDGVIVSSNEIGKHAQRFSKNVFVMDDPIDIDYFSPVGTASLNYDSPKFSWSGVSWKAPFLNRYSAHVDGKITLITDAKIKQVELDFSFEHKLWKYETFPHELNKCDIGLLPRVVDNDYDRGHSSFKALVYAALGKPIIANKIPSYVKLSEYYDSIVFLEEFDNDLTKCIESLNTRNCDISRVQEFYSCQNQAERLVRFLSQEK